MKNYGQELGWELGVDFPDWGNTEIYVKTISGFEGLTDKKVYSIIINLDFIDQI